MDTNENICSNTQDDVIELGIASVETKGGSGPIEPSGGPGLPLIPGCPGERR